MHATNLTVAQGTNLVATIVLSPNGANSCDRFLRRFCNAYESTYGDMYRSSWSARSQSATNHETKPIGVGGHARCSGHDAIH